MNLTLQSKLFRMKSLLNKVSDTSYAYAAIARNHPLDQLDERAGEELLKTYEQLVGDLASYIVNHEQRTKDAG